MWKKRSDTVYLFVSSLIFWHFTFLIWLFVPCLLKMIVYLKIINKISAFAWTNTCMHLYWRTNCNVEYVWNDASKKKFFFSSSVKCYKTNDTKRHGREKKFTKNDSIDCHAQYTIIIYSMYYGRSIMYSIGWIVKFLRQNESTISSEFNCI